MRLLIESIENTVYKKNGSRVKYRKWYRERKLEKFIASHPHVLLGKNGHLLGRQIKWADIVGLDEQGRLMVVEIKKGGVRIRTVRQIAKHIKRLDKRRSNLCKLIKKEWENAPERRPEELKEDKLKHILKGWNGKIIAVIVGTQVNKKTIRKFGDLQNNMKKQGFDCWIVLFHRLGKERIQVTIVKGRR